VCSDSASAGFSALSRIARTSAVADARDDDVLAAQAAERRQRDDASITRSRLCAGSPMPMKTTRFHRSAAARQRDCATISASRADARDPRGRSCRTCSRPRSRLAS
jgi:hypothetical protein